MRSLTSICITLFITALCINNGMGIPAADPAPGVAVNIDINVNGMDNKDDSQGHNSDNGHDSDKESCHHWSYPSKDWPYICPSFCSGKSQSPIDICANSTSPVTGSFTFSSSYSDPIPKITIKNNGHTAGASWSSSVSSRTISGGGLSGTYTLAQFHFHWGCKDCRGSEHTVYGTRYPMELHFVHYKTSYGNLTNALKYADGLAVLGIFFDLGAENPTLKPITDNFKYIKECVSEKEIDFNKALIDLIPATRTFYRYQGSLTTPTCNEVVIWSVFSEPIRFSQDQVKQFRTLMCHEHEICDNYRGIQPLNGRLVSKYTA